MVITMKLLHIFDKNDYDPSLPMFHRDAVRAVLIDGDKLELIYSRACGYYKFPGGGIESGETHIQALIRETKEEMGRAIIPGSVKLLGMVRERRKGLFPNELFEHDSYYYFAEIDKNIKTEPVYDEHEKKEDYILVCVPPAQAAEVNIKIAKKHCSDFIMREAFVMDYVSKMMKDNVV